MGGAASDGGVDAAPRRPVPDPRCRRPDGAPGPAAGVAGMVTVGAAHRALAEALGPHATLLAPLGPLTTYGAGGPAAVLLDGEGPADLEALRGALHDSELPLFVIGRGSNLLVADDGFDGVVIRLGAGFAALGLAAASGVPEGAAG